MKTAALILSLALLLTVTGYAQTADEWINKAEKEFKQADSFDALVKKKEEEFDLTTKSLELAFKNIEDLGDAEFKKLVEKTKDRWGEFQTSTVQEWVTYSGEADSEVVTNFSDQGKYPGSIIVKSLVEFPEAEAGDEISVELEKKMRAIAKKKMNAILRNIISVKDPTTGEYIFNGQIQEKKSASLENVIQEVPKIVNSRLRIVKKIRPRRNGKPQREYQLKIELLPNHVQKRAKIYLPQIMENAREQDIPISLVLAVIHTESSFNPFARSSVAYGLMQLVPKSGAMEAYRFLYNTEKLVSPKYLLNPRNNIRLGVAYLGKMIHHDLKGVENWNKRYLLASSSYNTGHGNTAKGLKKITDIYARYPRPTLTTIANLSNQLSIAEIFDRLRTYLPYEETRSYVQQIKMRRNLYQSYDN